MEHGPSSCLMAEGAVLDCHGLDTGDKVSRWETQ